METVKNIDIAEINYMLQIYGQVVATPGISEENKDVANKNIKTFLDLLEPATESFRLKYSRFTP